MSQPQSGRADDAPRPEECEPAPYVLADCATCEGKGVVPCMVDGRRRWKPCRPCSVPTGTAAPMEGGTWGGAWA